MEIPNVIRYESSTSGASYSQNDTRSSVEQARAALDNAPSNGAGIRTWNPLTWF